MSIYSLMYPFPYFEPICCSMPSSTCWFLTRIQVSPESGKEVWYSHLLKNFPQFVVIHTVKGFSIFNEAEVDVFLEFLCFFYDPANVGNLISGSSAFSKSSLYIWKFLVHIYYVQNSTFLPPLTPVIPLFSSLQVLQARDVITLEFALFYTLLI